MFPRGWLNTGDLSIVLGVPRTAEDFTDSTGAKLHHTLAETSRPRKSLRDGLAQAYRLRIGPLMNAFTDGAVCSRS